MKFARPGRGLALWLAGFVMGAIATSVAWPTLHQRHPVLLLDVPADDWKNRATLPRLTGHSIEPLCDLDLFEKVQSFDETSYVWKMKRQEPVFRPPLQFEEDAIAIARNWLTRHFGPSQPEVEIRFSSVIRQGKAPHWYQGHTVSFDCFFHGIKLDGQFILVHLTGDKVTGLNGVPMTYEIVPGSDQKILSLDEARVAGSEIFKKRGYPEKVWMGYAKYGELELQYLGSEPVWILDPQQESLHSINAHTGQYFFND